MDKIKFADTETPISPVSLGTMGFGDPDRGFHTWTIPYEKALPIIEKAWKSGINFFDTAPVYSDGGSEEILGKAFKELEIPREELFIATKYFPRSEEEIKQGVSAEEHIRQWLEGSLKRLQTDYVDLYIMHKWDFDTPIEETLKILNDLVREGKIRNIGLSNAYAWQVARANEIAKANGWIPFKSIQNHYNAIFREEERETIPMAREYGMTITPYSALAAGRLSRNSGSTNRLEKDTYAMSKYEKAHDKDQPVIDEVERISQELRVPMSTVALSWLIDHSDAPVVGATRPEQIEGIVQAAELDLSPEQKERIEAGYTPHEIVGVMSEYDRY